MNQVNIFTAYKQLENDCTNGFVSLLSLAPRGHTRLLNQLLNDELGLHGTFNPDDFLVLEGIDGYADGEVSAADFCIWFETKIRSGMLRKDQVRQHLKMLDAKSQTRRYLVLLTPDDSRSSYIQGFRAIDHRIRHLEWRHAYDLLESPRDADIVFSALAHQFRAHIQKTIFKQDLAGGILKISFGKKSGLDAKTYLGDMPNWTRWDSPRQYKNLDGTGRKLLLYDHTRKGLTVEAEIGSVAKTNSEPDYPWTNELVPGTMKLFDPPIPLEHIRTLENFQDFGVPRKDRNAFRNLTRDQYRLLLGQA
jgi:hypothetical protein